jgi:hypothetical protein
MIRIEDIEEALAGRWVDVFSKYGSDALRYAAGQKIGKHVPCPFPEHPGRSTDGFRIWPKGLAEGVCICNTCGTASGFNVLMRANGWSASETRSTLMEYLGWDDRRTVIPIRQYTPPPPPPAKTPEEREQIRLNLNKRWSESILITERTAEPARMYFAFRGIDYRIVNPHFVRFHPRLTYVDTDTGEILGRFPALVSMVVDKDGTPITLHRTYLTLQGRQAPVPQPKKLMGYDDEALELSGGAIRLFRPTRMLGFAEGIETALSAYQARGIPAWSAVNATMLEKVWIPDVTEQVVIYADKDLSRAGDIHARKLAVRAREQGKQALVLLPRGDIPDGAKSLDWNDVLRMAGQSGFHTSEHLQRVFASRRAA